mgnify:CR=1 FL=1
MGRLPKLHDFQLGVYSCGSFSVQRWPNVQVTWYPFPSMYPSFFSFVSQYIGYVTRHGRLFGNTNYHSLFFFRQCKDNAKIRLSEPGKEVVLVSDTEMQKHRVLKTALFM